MKKDSMGYESDMYIPYIKVQQRQQWNATATIPLAPSPDPNPILYNFPIVDI